MVPGGYKNLSKGIASFAAGYEAEAYGDGEFVWADYLNAVFEPSSATHGWGIGNDGNTFNVRATGGVWFVTGVDDNFEPTTSVYLNPGSGTWASTSDRAVKENFRVTDPLQILTKVVALPIESWNYIAEGAKVRHVGPVSQDFWAAFALGANDRTITTIDEGGVALAAIQGLHQLVQEKDARIEALEQRVSELQTLRGELATLKAMVADMASANGKVANR